MTFGSYTVRPAAVTPLTKQREPADRYETHDLLRLLVAMTLLLLPVAAIGVRNISPGFILLLVMLPVALPIAWSVRDARVILSLGVAALASAPVLTYSTSASGTHTYDLNVAISSVRFFVVCMATLVALLWGRAVLGDRLTAAFYGVGAFVQGAMILDTSHLNAWKYALAWPTAIIILSLVAAKRVTVSVMIILGSVSAYMNYRSFAALCAVAAMFFLWAHRSRRSVPSLAGALVVLIGFVYLTHKAFTALAIGGYLGATIQARTEAQTSAGRSLLLGGRPEWSGALELFTDKPLGFGPGSTPNLDDVQAVKEGLARVGASTNSEYVDHFMLDRHVELHSVISDLWVDFGLVGLLLGAVIGVIICRGLLRRACESSLTGMVALSALVGLWHLTFSPRSGLLAAVFAIAFLVRLEKPSTLGRTCSWTQDSESAGQPAARA